MKFVKFLILAVIYIFAFASPVMVATSPLSTVSAACDDRFLGIPPWYRGLTDGDCNIQALSSAGLSRFIWTIVLNIIEMAIVIVAYIATFFIIYGGFLYMTGGSNPSQVEKARKSILEAVIGLVIAMAAIALTNLVFGIIT